MPANGSSGYLPIILYNHHQHIPPIIILCLICCCKCYMVRWPHAEHHSYWPLLALDALLLDGTIILNYHTHSPPDPYHHKLILSYHGYDTVYWWMVVIYVWCVSAWCWVSILIPCRVECEPSRLTKKSNQTKVVLIEPQFQIDVSPSILNRFTPDLDRLSITSCSVEQN